MKPRVLVAGMGNVLRGDDAFGVKVAEALSERSLPPGVEVVEVGIGGMHLVQQLMEEYEALVVVDAVDREAEPGTVFVLRPEVPEVESFSDEERRAVLGETHHTVPSRVLVVAKALGILPDRAYIVGCQSGGDELGIGMSAPVEAAVDEACDRVEELVDLLVDGKRPEAATPRPPEREEG